MTPSAFELAAIVLGVCALALWINAVSFKLPLAAWLLITGLAVSAAMAATRWIFPDAPVVAAYARLVSQVDYPRLVLNFMLAYMLFAGAMNVDLGALARRAWAVGVLASLGTVVTAAIAGAGFWTVCKFAGFPIPLSWALVFGVLISPTDPIAVIAMTRRSTLQPELQAQLEGEALFNDGVAVVAFKAVTAFAIGSGLDHGVSLALAEQAALAAVGGAGLGLVCGFAAVLLIRVVDDWISETLITVATATAVYALALHFDLSGPVGVVVSGLVVGSQWAERRMSKVTLRHIHPFWRVLDEGMNAVLFFLLGVEVWALGGTWSLVWLAVCGPVVVLLARWVAVSIPLSLLPLAKGERRVNLINVVTWAGVRGGLPVAMALALPDVPARQPILAATFAVVLFSILLQSMTTERLALRTGYGHPAAQA